MVQKKVVILHRNLASDDILHIMEQVVLGIISRSMNNNKKYLLVSSVLDFGKYTGFYYPPGGQLNKDDDEKSALIRKLKEELGIVVTPLKKLAETPADVENTTIHWWTCDSDVSRIKIDPNKIDGYKWLTKEEIHNYKTVWPATKKFFEEYMSD